MSHYPFQSYKKRAQVKINQKNLLDDILSQENMKETEDPNFERIQQNNREISEKIHQKHVSVTKGRNLSLPVLDNIETILKLNTKSPPKSGKLNNLNTDHRTPINNLHLKTHSSFAFSSSQLGISPPLTSRIRHSGSSQLEASKDEKRIDEKSKMLYLPANINANLNSEEAQDIEKITAARAKLKKDKMLTISKSISSKRDISYLHDNSHKPMFSQTNTSSFFNQQGRRKISDLTVKDLGILEEGSNFSGAQTARSHISGVIRRQTDGDIQQFGKKDLSSPLNSLPGLPEDILQRTQTSKNKFTNTFISPRSENSSIVQNFTIHIDKQINVTSSEPPKLRYDLPYFSKEFNKPNMEVIEAKDYLLQSTSKGWRHGHGSSGASQIWKNTPYKNLSQFEGKRLIEQDTLLNDLKKEIPSLFSGTPASRSDILTLSQWTQSHIKRVVESPLPENEKLFQCDEIYNICLNEIIRQISIECAERGELLLNIWSSYIHMFSKFREHALKECEATKEKYFLDNRRSKLDHLAEINEKDALIEKLLADSKSIKTDMESLKKNYDKLLDKESKLKERFRQIKKIAEAQKKIINELKEENRFYIQRYSVRTAIGKRNDTDDNSPSSVESTPAKQRLNAFSDSPFVPKNQGYQPSIFKRRVSVSSVAKNKEGSEIRFDKSPDDKETLQENSKYSISSSSEDSEAEIVLEDARDNSRQIYKIDELNHNTVLAYKVLHKDEEKSFSLMVPHHETHSTECQTDLRLCDPKYDNVLESQRLLDEFLSEIKLRKEVDILAEMGQVNDSTNHDLFYFVNGLNPTSKFMLEDKLDGIEPIPAATLTDLTKLPNISPIEDMFMKNGSPRLSNTTPTELEKNSKRLEKKTKTMKLMLQASPLTHDTTPDSIEKPWDNNTIEDIDNSGQETPKNDKEAQKSFSSAYETSPNPKDDNQLNVSKESSNTDEIFQGLEEAASEYTYEESMHMIEEENEDGMPKQAMTMTDLDKYNQLLEKVPSKKHTLSLNSLTSGLSMAVIANLKVKMNRFASGIRREDNAILEKAKLLQVVRMYKVEREKNKNLSSTVSELQEQLLSEKEKSGKAEEAMTELRQQIKILEALKRVCPHGKCHICAEENGFSHTEKEIGLETVIDLDETEEDADDGDNGDNGDNGDEKDLGEETPANKLRRDYLKRRSTFKVTTGQSPELGKKIKGREQNPALSIIEKLKTKKMGKFQNFMPAKAVLKQIQILYTERSSQSKENPGIKEEDLPSFTYTYFLNTFGFKKLAEQKFIIFILSIKKYLHIVRINLFARFMGLLEGSSNYNTDEFNKYIEGVDFINNSTLGSPIYNNDTDPKHYTPYLRCLEYVRYFSENKMPAQEYADFKREFENLKKPDPKNINRVGIIDVDLFMTKILTKYRIICNKTKQYVVNAFKAADLDGNKYCSLKEFAIIYKYIEPDKYDFNFVENLFNQYADVRLEREVNLSFDKFTVVCVEYGLFSDAQQDLFLEISTPEELEEKMTFLKQNWENISKEITTTVNEMKKMPEEEKKYWLDILRIIAERISNPEAINSNDHKTILIAFKILQKEVESYKENEIETDEYGIKKTV